MFAVVPSTSLTCPPVPEPLLGNGMFAAVGNLVHQSPDHRLWQFRALCSTCRCCPSKAGTQPNQQDNNAPCGGDAGTVLSFMNCLRQPSPEGDLRRVNSVLPLREGHAFGIEGRLDRLLESLSENARPGFWSSDVRTRENRCGNERPDVENDTRPSLV